MGVVTIRASRRRSTKEPETYAVRTATDNNHTIRFQAIYSDRVLKTASFSEQRDFKGGDGWEMTELRNPEEFQ
ncbi:hypothetical protein NECAME_06375 [Necator americanus]|uniref:Uncharacterized protein n=1 Tax=Necator americanus TaxID=51031 RepID=W2TUE6_NECAM|nr:hypothetical protein NECAME_06375 [Necator americanus]ETN85423.1 hypothetical protein NECAME_06375 [Necator americanus]